jgi:hypothetical protein
MTRRDGDGALLTFDLQDSGELEWRDIARHSRIQFSIAFPMNGPEAFDVTIK